MSVPTRKLVDKEGREIFSGDRKVVEPMLFSSGSGTSVLTEGYDAHGLGYLQGNGWRGDVHLAGDGAVLTIPLDIKLKDITSATWLEKTSTNQVYNNTLQVIFQIDFDDNGVYTETSDDRFLFNGWQNSYGHPTWTKVNGIANVNMHGEALDTFLLKDGAWAAKATADGAITSGTEASFAAFQATTLGEHRVKAMQIVYTGEKTGTADYWVQAANFEINGIFYELQPKVVPYEFTINGINFKGYEKIKMLTLDADSDDDDPHPLNFEDSPYQVPTGKVFIAYQALAWFSQPDTVGKIGEADSSGGAISKEVLRLSNGTNLPFMTNCWGVFTASKYITAETTSSYQMKSGCALYGAEVDI